MPSGASLDTTTGVIAWASPTTTGQPFYVVVNATNGAGTGVNGTITIAVGNVPAINSAFTATATVGTPFTYTITATNSPSSYGASSLPSWASRTGAVISGTPTTVSGSPFSSTVSATNIYGTGSHGLTITVNPETLTAVTITGPFLATGSPLTPTYTTTPSGGTVAFTPSTETAAGTYSLAWSGTGDYTGSGTTSWTIQPVASSLTAHGAVSLP
jgi:hypothetical protein